MALMKHSELFELLETHGLFLLDTKFQSEGSGKYGGKHGKAAVTSSRMAIKSMLEELAPNLWEDDLNRLVDFGHLISPELEMVKMHVNYRPVFLFHLHRNISVYTKTNIQPIDNVKHAVAALKSY